MLSYSTVKAHTLELMNELYFDDADAQMMPVMFSERSWDDIKAYLSDMVKSFE